MLLIGDIHGQYKQYLDIITLPKYINRDSIQLGDFGFNYDCLAEHPTHKVLPGNHENYDLLLKHPNCLGNYGTYKNIFFVRGAQSIDRKYRTEGVNWWRNEELSYKEFDEAINLYEKLRPEIVISHTCPKFVIPYLGGKSYWGSVTETALSMMWSIHQPLLWIFGHFHPSLKIEYSRTSFICLNELETLEL